jgi:TrmH family RNA methyltransferase
MLNKADIKLVKSLGEKDVRYAKKLFVAEGSKSVADLLASNLKVEQIYALPSWFSQIKPQLLAGMPITHITNKELEQMSSLKSTREVIAVFKMPEFWFEPKEFSGIVLALDTIQDPGNLGTLIRLADWYGIEYILCSTNTVDCYNNKVVQSTMGSIGRVKVLYGDLADWFAHYKLPIIAASMEGQEARKFHFPKDMILLIGNEGAGINPDLKAFLTNTISIEKRGEAESLNAAVAASILVDRYFGQFSI